MKYSRRYPQRQFAGKEEKCRDAQTQRRWCSPGKRAASEEPSQVSSPAQPLPPGQIDRECGSCFEPSGRRLGRDAVFHRGHSAAAAAAGSCCVHGHSMIIQHKQRGRARGGGCVVRRASLLAAVCLCSGRIAVRRGGWLVHPSQPASEHSALQTCSVTQNV